MSDASPLKTNDDATIKKDDLLVEVEDLHKTYVVGLRRKKFQAVRGLSFQVRRGEVFGIVGPNGAGKTSTIKILTGLMRPTSGKAKLFGISTDSIESRRKLGYLPESPYFYEHLKAPELLRYYGQLHGIAGDVLDARIPQLIDRVGLSHATDRPLKKFSKGMRQRAGLAQALINDPELIILDEPQSGLDPVGRREVRDLIFDLKRQGKTVVFSSHILPDVEAVCDRVALFHKGKIIEQGRLDDLLGKRTHAYELLIANLADRHLLDALPGLLDTSSRGDFIEARFALDYDLPTISRRIQELGGAIQSIQPLREDLEQIFIRDTAHSTPEQDTAS